MNYGANMGPQPPTTGPQHPPTIPQITWSLRIIQRPSNPAAAIETSFIQVYSRILGLVLVEDFPWWLQVVDGWFFSGFMVGQWLVAQLLLGRFET